MEGCLRREFSFVSNTQPFELTLKQKFQDLEEERLDFTKSSLWAYANIASTVCVSDDAVSSND
jgi:hypothetical protein